MDLLALIGPAIYYIKVGGFDFFKLFFVFQYVYFGWKILDDLKARYVLKTRDSLAITKSSLKFLLYFNAMFFGYVILLGFLVRLIYMRGVGLDVTVNNDMYMELDRFFFGEYLPLWWQSSTNDLKSFFDFISPAIIGAFALISFSLSMSFVLVLILSAKNFTKMIVALALIGLVSFPFWYIWPSTSPMQGYIDNVFNADIPVDIQVQLDTFTPNQNLMDFLDLMREKQDDGQGGKSTSFTTMPSMHVGWASILAYYAIRSRRKLAYFYVPYWFLNCLATVYLNQHYAIDVPGGIFVAALSIWLTSLMVKAPPAYIQRISDEITKDLKSISQGIRLHLLKTGS